MKNVNDEKGEKARKQKNCQLIKVFYFNILTALTICICILIAFYTRKEFNSTALTCMQEFIIVICKSCRPNPIYAVFPCASGNTFSELRGTLRGTVSSHFYDTQAY